MITKRFKFSRKNVLFQAFSVLHFFHHFEKKNCDEQNGMFEIQLPRTRCEALHFQCGISLSVTLFIFLSNVTREMMEMQARKMKLA